MKNLPQAAYFSGYFELLQFFLSWTSGYCASRAKQSTSRKHGVIQRDNA
jgi:hypothetical protein